MKVEIWKDIENFSKYQVSNLGRIKSKGRYTKVGIKNQDKCYRKEYIVDGFINKKGYKQVTLYDDNGKPKTMRVHKLVALAFIENEDNLPQINHKDGNKQNNCVDNLEWISNYDNIQHAIKNGLVNQELRKENMRKVGKTGIGAKIRWN
jgi:hypothetical protein